MLENFTFDPPIEPQQTDWRRPGPHIAMSVHNVPEMHRRLKASGISFIASVQYTAGAHWVFFRDPDGNLVGKTRSICTPIGCR